MSDIDEGQVQGLLKRGYGDLPLATALMVGFADADAARAWLREVRPSVTPAARKTTPLHLGLTFPGLRTLAREMLGGLPLEFVDGPATARASLVLGDSGSSAPEGWAWGGPSTPPIDAVMLLYGAEASAHEARVEEEAKRITDAGNLVVHRIDTATEGDYDHFGFRDGISQPVVEGFRGSPPGGDRIPAGEFVLGHENGYGKVDRVLYGSNPDFGRDGSYLVIRQLAQDPATFWRDMEAVGTEVGLDGKRLAAKVVGRESDGRPLTLPEGADYEPGSDPAILFRDAAYGACPLGAHIRRSNPRDAIPGVDDAGTSLKIARNHRILRRGRRYGETLTPEAALKAETTFDRGLLFMALNASIRRQFEFVQQTWLNDPKFGGLYDNVDVIAGDAAGTRTFTLQGDPVSRRCRFSNAYVRTVGSGYFFLPSLAALDLLAS